MKEDSKSESTSLLSVFNQWYLKQLDGRWERKHEIKIETLDNPGWFVSIDLGDTSLLHKRFKKLENDFSEQDWVHCWIRDSQFQAGGGPLNLEDIIRYFISWAELETLPECTDSEISWLQKWYSIRCNGDWEHIYGIIIQTTADSQWLLKVDLNETGYENNSLNEQQNGVHCFVENQQFIALSKSQQLEKLILTFRQWTESISSLKEGNSH